MDIKTTAAPNDPPIEQQRVVQRKLGRCLIRLQQYEHLLKTLVAHSDIAGPPEQLQTLQEDKIACAQRKTMGALVGILTESYLSPGETDEGASKNADTGNETWFRFRSQRELGKEQYEATKSALKELVNLRNELVHHFLERFNIWQADGCAAANTYLDESFEIIDRHLLTLNEWAESMKNTRAMMASFMQTPVIEDMFDGILPDGTVAWPVSAIVCNLREAEAELAQAGWTKLNAAIAWIREHDDTDQTPGRYGCSSWRHVIHESGQFDIRKEPTDSGTVVWYRSLPEEGPAQQAQAS
jgi:hypothetical protein